LPVRRSRDFCVQRRREHDLPEPERKKVSPESKKFGILKIPALSQTRSGLHHFIRPFHERQGDFLEWDRVAFVYLGPEKAFCTGKF
jgi:hypothetical protein